MIGDLRDPSGQFITVVLLDKHIKQRPVCVYSLRYVELSTLLREASFAVNVNEYRPASAQSAKNK